MAEGEAANWPSFSCLTNIIALSIFYFSIVVYKVQTVSKQLHRDKHEIAEAIMETLIWRQFRFCGEEALKDNTVII